MRTNPQLQELSLCNNSISDMHLSMLVESLPHGACHLRRLDVSHNHLTAASVRALLPHCCSTAAALKPPTTGALLSNAFRHANEEQALQDASDNGSAVSPAMPIPGHASTREVLWQGVTLLTHLNLSGNAIGDVAVKLLCGAMCKGGLVCELSILLLEGCKLSERCAPFLEEMLLTTRSLAQLSLAWNHLGPRGAHCIARGMESNISVTRLQMAWSGLSDTGCSHVADALKMNAALEVLDLAGNNAGYGTCAVIAEVLGRNTVLREVALHHNTLTQQGIRILLKAIMARSSRDVAIMLQRASFAKADESMLPVTLDQVNPDGNYILDLHHPGQRQVAIDLVKCAPWCLQRFLHARSSWYA
jgi:hypothetical protein